ncbi:TolC family protein [Daejeonella sp. JGW-45]|nr:TolC family protein [Daejeonella sp. JGW-45]
MCLALLAQAQEHTISLDKSKQAALVYSEAIKNGKLDIASAETDVKAAKSAYLPSVSLTGVGVYGFKDLIGPMPPMLEQGINNFYFAGASATQPVYVGGKIRTTNQLAALRLEVNKIRAKQSVDSVLLVTEQKYWNLVNIQEQHKTLLANEKLLDGILKQQNDLLASGLIARNDQLKVKVQRSKLLLNKSKLENGKKLALLDFCVYIGIPYDSLLVMQDILVTSSFPALVATVPDTSLAKNDSYRLLQKSLEAEKLQTRLTRSDLLPTVSIGANVAQIGSVNSGLGSSFMPVAMGTISVPISDWWGQGKQDLKKRVISEQKAQHNFEVAQNQLKVGITKAWYDLTDARKEIQFAKENLEQAKENLKVSQDNYASGLIEIPELMDAQTSYQEASSAHVNAYANFQLKVAVYQYFTGNLDGTIKINH